MVCARKDLIESLCLKRLVAVAPFGLAVLLGGEGGGGGGEGSSGGGGGGGRRGTVVVHGQGVIAHA
jgi:hypothetical protein